MSYRLRLDAKSIKSARFISRLQKTIQSALAESGLTQQQVAERIGVDRSVVNRRLKGKANLTARSIAEFAYAFDRDVMVTFTEKPRVEKCNHGAGTTGFFEIEPRQIGVEPSTNALLGDKRAVESV
jgi:transcriptional regulator with XRE-family HTH domain